jgi:hypothetical protein
VLVLGYCGLRFGEAVALRVGDVNVWARRIRVSRSVTYVTWTGLSKGSTKTTVLPPCRCRSSWPRYSKPRQGTGTTPSCCSGRIGAAIAQASLMPESTRLHDDATETALRTDPRLTEPRKRALLAVYRSYIEANDDGTADDVAKGPESG